MVDIVTNGDRILVERDLNILRKHRLQIVHFQTLIEIEMAFFLRLEKGKILYRFSRCFHTRRRTNRLRLTNRLM